MDNRMGRQFLNAPGPTNVPDEVLNAMHRPAVDLVDADLNATIRSCFDDVQKIAHCEDGESFLYAANGHGAWEAALVNVLSPGDRVLVCHSGLFSDIWTEMARKLGDQYQRTRLTPTARKVFSWIYRRARA